MYRRFVLRATFIFLMIVTSTMVPAPQAVMANTHNWWSPIASGTLERLNAVWGTSATDVFAVGVDGTILHYDGNTWSPMVSGILDDLSGVWGSASSDVFTVGENGAILHYNGSTWASMPSGTSDRLEDI